MSYSEDLCEKSLKLIFDNNVEIIRNYRPSWLKNPETNRNLELDFYIPAINMAIEIQGQHHYDNSDQIFRDNLKKYLSEIKNVYLLEVSIFQISPPYLWRKILLHCKFTNQIKIKKFDKTWLDIPDFKLYKQNIEQTYGKSTCTISPLTIHNKEKQKKDECKIMLNGSYSYEVRGKILKIIPIEISKTGKKVICRIAGSNEIIQAKKSKLLNMY